jgi:multidrug transporter EmrE-like cation transporter
MVFCGQGGSMTCLRWVRYAGLEDQLLKVIMVTGFTAGALGTVFLLVRRIRPSRTDISMGVLIGVYNLIALIALLTALNHVPGTVFFPLLGCTVVTLDNLAAHFFWQERLDRAAFLGVGLALTAILIVT